MQKHILKILVCAVRGASIVFSVNLSYRECCVAYKMNLVNFILILILFGKFVWKSNLRVLFLCNCFSIKRNLVYGCVWLIYFMNKTKYFVFQMVLI